MQNNILELMKNLWVGNIISTGACVNIIQLPNILQIKLKKISILNRIKPNFQKKK